MNRARHTHTQNIERNRSFDNHIYFDNLYLCNCCPINRHQALHRLIERTDDCFILSNEYFNAKITYKY